MCDCLIIGYNDFDFDENVKLIEKSGRNSGAFRDLRLSCIEYQGRYLRPLDALSRFYAEKPGNIRPPFHDMDFMWPTILYLGSYLDRHGLSFDYVNLFQFSKARLKEKLLAGGILSIAITTTLYVHPRPVLEIIKFIRKYNQSARIILGGPYVSSQSRGLSSDEFASLLRYLSADYFIINSEGEQALVCLLKALKDGSSPKEIPSLAFFEGDEFVRSAEVSEQNSLEGNEVNYSLFRKAEIGQFLSIRTARSCPFACDYCGFPQRSGKYRYLESELVEKELNRINDLGTVSTLTFLDDTFNVPKERFREILKIMIRNKYDFRWNSYYRSDHGAPDIIELMGKAGCEGVFMGIESGSDEMLKNMRKTARTHHYHQAIPLLREAACPRMQTSLSVSRARHRRRFARPWISSKPPAPTFSSLSYGIAIQSPPCGGARRRWGSAARASCGSTPPWITARRVTSSTDSSSRSKTRYGCHSGGWRNGAPSICSGTA